MENESSLIKDDFDSDRENKAANYFKTEETKKSNPTQKLTQDQSTKFTFKPKKLSPRNTRTGKNSPLVLQSLYDETLLERPIAMKLDQLRNMHNHANSLSDLSFSQDFESGCEQSAKNDKLLKLKSDTLKMAYVSSPNHGNPIQDDINVSQQNVSEIKEKNSNVFASENTPVIPTLTQPQVEQTLLVPKNTSKFIEGLDLNTPGQGSTETIPNKGFLTLKELYEEKKTLMATLKEKNDQLTKIVEEQGFKNLLNKIKENKTDFKNRPNEVKSNTYHREILNNEKMISTLTAEKAQTDLAISKINSPEFLVNMANEMNEQKQLIKILKTEIHTQTLENKKNAKLFIETGVVEKSAIEMNKLLKEIEVYATKNNDFKSQIDKLTIVHSELLSKKEKQKVEEKRQKDFSEEFPKEECLNSKKYQLLISELEKWRKHVDLIQHNVSQKQDFLERQIEALANKEQTLQDKLTDYNLILARQNAFLIRKTEKTDQFQELEEEQTEIWKLISQLENNYRIFRLNNFRGQPQKIKANIPAEQRAVSSQSIITGMAKRVSSFMVINKRTKPAVYSQNGLNYPVLGIHNKKTTVDGREHVLNHKNTSLLPPIKTRHIHANVIETTKDKETINRNKLQQTLIKAKVLKDQIDNSLYKKQTKFGLKVQLQEKSPISLSSELIFFETIKETYKENIPENQLSKLSKNDTDFDEELLPTKMLKKEEPIIDEINLKTDFPKILEQKTTTDNFETQKLRKESEKKEPEKIREQNLDEELFEPTKVSKKKSKVDNDFDFLDEIM